jgi:hypothetical protein
MSGAGRALFAANFVIIDAATSSHTTECSGVRRLDFALSIKKRLGRRRCTGGAFAGQVSVLLRAVL